MSLTVTPEAVAAIRELATNISDLHSYLRLQASLLLIMFDGNKGGLGYHSDSIAKLIEDLQQEAHSDKKVKQLVRRLRTSADIREAHITGTFPSGSPVEIEKTDAYIAVVIGRIYESGYRKMLMPSANGTWQGNTFIPDSDYKPTKYNPNDRTFGQIIQHLEDTYGIHYTGTPFVDGHADFSQIALAQVSVVEMSDKHLGDTFLYTNDADFDDIFSSRSQNLRYADQVAAKKQLPIPGLPQGYTATDLADWRKTNHFTWDESYLNDYLLVPSEIHNNISHTGLVGISTHGNEAVQNITKRIIDNTTNKDDF